jgi:hypothetical protein
MFFYSPQVDRLHICANARNWQVEERKGEYEQAELKLRQTVQDREDQLGPLHSYLQQDLAASSLLYFRVGGACLPHANVAFG